MITCPLPVRLFRSGFFRLNSLFRVLAVLALLMSAGSPAQAQTAYFSGTVSVVGSGLSYPTGVAVDASGDVFVADSGNNAVKEIVAVNGVVSSTSQVIVVGSGFDDPAGVAVDASGDVFVADTDNNAVKEIVASNGVVTASSTVKIVGSGFSHPTGVALDSSGDVFVADSSNNAVKEIVASNGVVTASSTVKIVGSGFADPFGVAVDASGDVFVADYYNNAVKEIVASNGVVTASSTVKIVGSGFSYPAGVAVDSSGDVFVAAQGNNAVKEIVASNGVVTASSTVKIVGSGFSYPEGVAVDSSGDVFVADTNNSAVKEIQLGSVNLGSVAVGSTTAATLTFTFDTGGLIAVPKVVTQGATGLDFTDVGDGTCTTNGTSHTYNAGDTCTVDVKFAPAVPGLRMGAVELFASSGTTPIATAYVYGTGTGPMVSFPSNPTITSLGGGFTYPSGVAVDSAQNVYVIDGTRTPLKELTPNCLSSNCVTLLGDESVLASGLPTGVAIDGSGNVYVIFGMTGLVAKIPPGCTNSSCITYPGGSAFSEPYGLAVDGSGNVYVADGGYNAVYEMPPGCNSSTCVITLGGGSAGGKFGGAHGVAVDSSGNVYVAVSSQTAVEEMPANCHSSSCVSTLGGGFSFPEAVAVDAAGNVYVADTGHNLVKQMPAGCTSASCVTTLAGSYSNPNALTLDGSGNLYVADTGNNKVKELPFATPPTVTFATSTQDGMTDTTDSPTVTVANIGNEPLIFPVPSVGTNPTAQLGGALASPGFGLADPPGTCTILNSSSSLAFTVAVGSSCLVDPIFQPVTPQNGTVTGAVVLTDNSLNAQGPNYATQSIPLSGKAVGGDTTTTNVIVSPNFVGLGGSVSVTAVISDTSNGSHTPTGSVTFTDTVGSVTTNLNSGAAVPLSGNSAHLNVTLSADGVHTITANYSGVAGTYLSSSGTAMVTVGAATHFSVTAPASAYAGQPFTSTVTALDENNQVATLYAGTVAITSSDSAAVLPANATLTNGVGTFTVTLNTPGGQSVVATDTVTSSITGGATVSVSPPPTYTVTVATDTTSGVASNCVANVRNSTNCSLRDAIAAVTALNLPTVTPTIQFSPLLTSGGPVTITEGSAGTLTIGANMNIVGPGQTLLAIDGANLYQVFAVNTGVTASISGVTIQHGNFTSTVSLEGAGGIYNQGALAVTNSSIVNSAATVSAGAIVTSGPLTLTGSTIANNTSGGGAALQVLGTTLNMSGSAVTGNTSAGNGVPTSGGGILVGRLSTALISNSTISDNSATSTGYGGGISLYLGSATLTNVTVSGNSSTLYGGGISNYSGTLTLIQSTFTGNSARYAGGIYDYKENATTLTNSVVAGNSASTTYPNIFTYPNSAAPTDNGGNVYDTTATSTLNPNLAVLGSYGGSTQTMPGLPGSPVLCAGLASNVGSLTTDQRGNPRVATYGSNQCVDSGAVQTAYSLSFSQQPSNTETGLTLSPAPAVKLVDNGVANGIPGASIGIALTNGPLSGLSTATTDSTGTATFNGLSIPAAETGDTLTASATAGTNTFSATSNSFNVVAVTATPQVASEVLTQYQPAAYFTPVTGSGGTAPLVYSIAPALPAGLSLSSTTGAITGSPTVTLSASTFTITVTDALNVTGKATFSLTVNAAVQATPVVASTALTQNHASAFTPVTGSGGTGALSYSVSPALPAGLSLSSTTGAITGTPTVVSPMTTYLMTVTDTNNATSAASFKLTVNTAVTATQAVPSTTLVVNQPATAFTPVTGAGGTGSLSYSVSPGLPTGLSLSSTTGAISGTPTVTSSATTYTVTVTDTNGATATATFSLTVILSVPPTVSSVSAVTTTYGSTTGITVTATESGNEGLATGGVVTFSVVSPATGTFSPATCTLSSAGTCTTTFTPTGTLAAGTYTGGIKASFALVNSYSAATGTSTLTVNQAAQTINFAAPTSPVTYGTGPYTLSATGGASGNPVTFSIVSGGAYGSLSGTNNSTLTITGVGTIVIAANQASSANYLAATQVTQSVVVNQAAQTIAFAPASPVTYGVAPITLTATGGASGNPVTYSLGSGPATLSGSVLTITGAGTVSVTANQAGNADYTAASAVTATILVNKATPTVQLTSSVNPVLVQNAVTLTATVGGVTVPTGSINFYDNTAGASLGSVGLTSGVAALQISSLAVGTHSITAIYSGDSNFVSVTSSPVSELVEDFTLTIAPTNGSMTSQTVPPGSAATYSFTLSMTNGSNFPAAVALTATGAPAGSVVTISPSTLAAGSGSTPVTLTIQTPAVVAMEHRNDIGRGLAPFVLALLVLPFSRRMRRSARKLGRYAIAALLLLAAAGATVGLTGCGTGNGVFAQPQQTYTVTITGTSGALSHSTTVTLTVE